MVEIYFCDPSIKIPTERYVQFFPKVAAGREPFFSHGEEDEKVIPHNSTMSTSGTTGYRIYR